jgi:class 3 adenylate cyclase
MALRIAVIMKTDIVGSTPRFRAELAGDLEALLREHQKLVAKCAADHGGSIFKSAGDGFWLEFPSATAAARSGIAMQDELRLGQLTIGDTRIAIRITIGVGDVSMQGGDLVGELLALVSRIETVTPADELYLTAGARLALSAAEVQTELVENFALKGFPDPVSVYRVQRRHRTQVIPAAFMLIADLRGFTQLTRTAEVGAVERVLETLEALVNSAAREHGGTIRFNSAGDAYFLTFPEPSLAVTAAEQLLGAWVAARAEDRSGLSILLLLHRGTINVFRSSLWGEGYNEAWRVMATSGQCLPKGESGLFITTLVRDALAGGPWHKWLRPVSSLPASGLELYRLDHVEMPARKPDAE